ncbi:CLUMA_CG003417, isoform A [Clunio marinus]|uniref:CLUMA_CG003417, isoform A n=1 Tax=Clunio marinus TaxID=568069 RepID=A0A1J1HNW9_9DIPT|nr:CLUMA_CG003417, isoform A [Clunio marinus]
MSSNSDPNQSGKPSNVAYKGTNAEGNSYTKYNNEKYSYTNYKPSGDVQGRYFNDGRGHGFYKQNATAEKPAYAWHENARTETRTYIEKGSGSRSSGQGKKESN